MFKPASISDHIEIPRQWNEIAYGKIFCQSISLQLRPWLTKLYGCHFLKLGALSGQINTTSCPIPHQFTLASTPPFGQIIADPQHLPFASKSIDACLLAHSLSWQQDPHQVLREVDRVLIDDGWMIITGFNPFSLVSVARILSRGNRPLKRARLFSQLRLIDWLSLMHYEIELTCQIQTRLSKVEQQAPAERWAGTLILLQARKRTRPLTPKATTSGIKGYTLQPIMTHYQHHEPYSD